MPDVVLNASLDASSRTIRSGTTNLAHINRLEVRQLLISHDQVFHSVSGHEVIELLSLELEHASPHAFVTAIALERCLLLLIHV